MDVFRIFDSVNYIENMKLGIDAVGKKKSRDDQLARQ